MVTKVFNIQPFFISIICDLNFVTGIPFFAFTFKFAILVSHFTRKDNCLLLISIHLSLFKTKTKDDSLLFLIKKHNNNKTVRYNDKLAYITFINKNE